MPAGITQQDLSDAGKLWVPFAATVSTAAQNLFHDTWTSWLSITGSDNPYPTPGASPGSAAGSALDKSSTGALRFVNAPSGKKNYLSGYQCLIGDSTTHDVQPNVYQLLLFDRLVHTSALSGTSVLSQTVNSTALPARATGGAGVLAFMRVWTALGGTDSTITVTYTNQSGTGSRTGTIRRRTGSPAEAYGANVLHPMEMQVGDTGVRSIQSAQLSGTTGTVGDWGFVLMRPIAVLESTPNEHMQGAISCGLAAVEDDACLSMALNPPGSNLLLSGHLQFSWL